VKKKVLFICTHNSARSQMAEGLLNHFYGNEYEGLSAGTQPGRVHPMAITVMNEIGIDISSHYSKNVREFLGQPIHTVLTVCDSARETCPFFPGAQLYLHESFKDPSAAQGTDEEKLAVFRSVRNEIQTWIRSTFGNL